MSSFTTNQCSVCDNNVNFHPQTNYIHCTKCNSVLYKNEDDKLDAKLLTPISKPSSPIQIGTTGVYGGNNFTVIGRCKLEFENETISFFTIAYVNDSIGILVLNAGIFSIGNLHLLNQDQIAVANGIIHSKQTNLFFNDTNCICTNTQTAKNVEVEGNFFFVNVFNEIKYYSFNYNNNSKLIIFKGNELASNALLETYVSFDDLQLHNLCTANKTIASCSVCQNKISIYDIENTVVANCSKCNSNLLFKNNQQKQQGKNETKGQKIYFELDDELEFYNTKYTIIGICIKQDFTIYKSKWREYCLYHPTNGYLFLNEFDGHWIVVNKLYSNADTTEEFEIIEFDKKEYELYNKYSFRTIFIQGSFPYNLFYNKQVTCWEYIAPPVMIIKEKNGNHVNWFTANHVQQNDLQKQCKNKLPYKIGVGAIEDKGQVQSKTIFLVALFCLLFTVVVQFLTSTNKSSQNIINENYNFPDSVNTVLYSINNVALDKASSNLNIEVSAPVGNAWFELNIELINNNTGERFYAEQGLEYYSGYEDGEYWKEGTTTDDVTISKIPKGVYTINLTAMQEAGNNKVSSFNVNIVYDLPIFRNFMLVFIGIILFALIAFIRSYYINIRRWENSPYFEIKYPSTSNE